MENKTILHLEDTEVEQELFKLQLKRSGLLEQFGINLISVNTPKDALKYLNTRKIDLVVSDVRNDSANAEEVTNFLKIALKKSKLIFYTAAEYDIVPKLENVPYVRKLSETNIFDKIKETLLSTKSQHISEEAIFKITRPEYHIATPTDKLIAQMISTFKQTGPENHKVLQALLEFKQLRKELESIKRQTHSQKYMDDLMDKYNNVVKKIKKYKKENGYALKTGSKSIKTKEMHKIKEAPKFKKMRTI